MDYKAHWSHIYETKSTNEVSWYQKHPTLSLAFIRQTGVTLSAAIIDVGAGASTLADHLIASGYDNLTLLDLSGEALQAVRARLGEKAACIAWMEGDITTINLPKHHYDVWHDRAVFHFLTDASARQRYVDQVRHAVKPGGHVIVATFALDGPEKCSGLDVVRYDAASLHGAFGRDFALIDSTNETHQTPWESQQQFIYCYCRIGS
jgi:2-polyprenyl-3-methyl-5-hydroxy-6-metoxy-1,4-benzoquinol methylase